MAESRTSSNPRWTNAGGTKKQEVQEEASLLEHPGVVQSIVSYLGLWEVLSLSSCSKYLNGVCKSDCTWKELFQKRWGDPQSTGESSKDAQIPPVHKEGWKAAYIARQKEKFAKISKVLLVIKERIQNDGLSSHEFHVGIDKLKALEITYDDIYSFFFNEKLNVVFTMLGLYYAFFFFHIPKEDLKKAMVKRGVIDKLVCARWVSPKSWQFGFYMPEEEYMRVYSLGQVVEQDMSILYIMRQDKRVEWQLDRRSNMTFSCKIPEPKPVCDCATHAEKERLEKECVGGASTSSH